MKLWVFMRSLRPAQLWKLLIFSVGNLSRIWPTWQATKKSVAYASKYYGRQHHKNSPANAFRHALWNYLIARKCMKNRAEIEEILSWTKKITDLHENLFPNSDLARAMDLHNNAIGRLIFRDHMSKSETEILQILLEMTKDSQRVYTLEQLGEVAQNQMIHIETVTGSGKIV
ncbi:MAG: DUF6973 domain-containing protein [Flavobacteriaceae bacterium]